MIRVTVQVDTEDLMALILALGKEDSDTKEIVTNFLKDRLELEDDEEEKRVNLKERTKIGF